MKKCKYCKTEIDKKAKICPQCKKKQISPVTRLLGVILVIFGVIVLFSGISNSGTDTKETEKSHITMEQFNQIETGMSYEDVKSIIGSDGTTMSEVDGGKMYYWYGKDGISNANFTFVDNKLIGKAQIGIK